MAETEISGQANPGFVNTRPQASPKYEARQAEGARAGEVNDENQITTHPEDKVLLNPSLLLGRTAHAQWPILSDLSNGHLPEGGTYNIIFPSDAVDVYVSSCPGRLGPEMRAIDGYPALVLNDRQACKP